jgi:hypothetical protein
MFDAARLNADCACLTLDRAHLRSTLTEIVGDPALCDRLFIAKPNLFSPRPVYLAADHAAAIRSAVATIEATTHLPGWQTAALAQAAEICRINHGPHGVFMGYDFHIGADGPKLIEINTNAGGALINACLLEAQRACCNAMAGIGPIAARAGELGPVFVETFHAEWRAAGRKNALKTIAIVDMDPANQYLYEEFVLFQRQFESTGLTALIIDPTALVWRDGALWADEMPIDLVYNRLTDFALTGSGIAALAQAYEANAVVLTPNPHLHAVKADKGLLTRLCDAPWLRSIGLATDLSEQIAAMVPPTFVVRPDAATELWAKRKTLFFKPLAGFGGKAAYRGDKLTRSTFETILASDYVAQALVPPSTRTAIIDGKRTELKLDVRAYAYAGKVLLMAARLYQGQTTNFRTTGGGWAPVFSADEISDMDCLC